MLNFEEFGFVNRSALVVKPKSAFNDWLQLIEPDDYSGELNECQVYLLKDYDETKQIEAWLKKNFNTIFSEQLYQWYVDESLWPQKRTFKMFQEWFDYWLCPLVLDTQNGMLNK